MSKNKRKSDRDSAHAVRSQRNLKRWIPVVSILVVAVLAAVVILALKANRTPPAKTAPPLAPAAPAPAPTVTPAPTTTSSKELVTMEVAKAVMVTVELDFGSKIPSIAEAITQIERRYQPDDGRLRRVDTRWKTPYVDACKQRKTRRWSTHFQEDR